MARLKGDIPPFPGGKASNENRWWVLQISAAATAAAAFPIEHEEVVAWSKTVGGLRSPSIDPEPLEKKQENGRRFFIHPPQRMEMPSWSTPWHPKNVQLDCRTKKCHTARERLTRRFPFFSIPFPFLWNGKPGQVLCPHFRSFRVWSPLLGFPSRGPGNHQISTNKTFSLLSLSTDHRRRSAAHFQIIWPVVQLIPSKPQHH